MTHCRPSNFCCCDSCADLIASFLAAQTGSQLPLLLPRSDARQNLVDSLTVAVDIPAHNRLSEVSICFGGKLLRGNRAQKVTLWAAVRWNSVLCWFIPMCSQPRCRMRHLQRLKAVALTVCLLAGALLLVPGLCQPQLPRARDPRRRRRVEVGSVVHEAECSGPAVFASCIPAVTKVSINSE